MMELGPVTEVTGYTTVPLQGTGKNGEDMGKFSSKNCLHEDTPTPMLC